MLFNKEKKKKYLFNLVDDENLVFVALYAPHKPL